MIELQDLTKMYTIGTVEVHALNGVTLSIPRGEMTAIMGPSGSGKSTLMSMMGCLDVPTSGSYVLDGEEVGSLGGNRLAEIRSRKIGVELPMLYGDGRDSRRRALEALERVGLADRVNHRPTELSGGQQQRVGIARALVKDPSILLTDEPTGNLDSRSSEEIMNILKRLNRDDGMTIVLVTHGPEIAAQAGRVVSMRDGVVVSDERNDHSFKAAAEAARGVAP